MDKTKKRRIAGNLIVLIVSVFVSLLLAEVVLRKISPVGMDTSFRYRIPDPILGWVLKPNLDYVEKISGEKVPVEYNSRGFRDVEHNIENYRGRFRMVVLGDSFMEAYSVQLNDAFHRRLDKLIRDKGIDSEVINLGVGGYGTLQEYLLFHQIGKRYRPEIILLGFYLGNDIRNNSFALESISNKNPKKPANRLLKVSSRPFLDPSDATGWTIIRSDYEEARRRYLETKQSEDSFFARWTEKSALVQSSVAAAGRIADMLHSNKHDTEEINGDLKNKYLAMYGANYCKEPPEYSEAWAITERILARLRNDASDIGSKLVVFTVPARHEVDPIEIRRIVKNSPDPGVICLEGVPAYRRLSEITKRLNIEYVDLLPAFRDIMRTKGIVLYGSDNHWNRRGHALAAKLVLKGLIERNMLPSDKAANSGQSSVVRHRHFAAPAGTR
jgi:hypothetical protein